MMKNPKSRTVKKYLIRSLFVFALLFSASGGAAMADPAYWRVDGEQGTLYLFGTIHVLPEGTKWLSPEVEAIFNAADSLVLEVVSSEEEDDSLTLLAQNTNVFRSNIPLNRRIGPELFASLLAHMEPFGVEEAQLNQYQIWYAAAILSQLDNEDAGRSYWFGVDSVLQEIADEQGKRLVALETAVQQILFFSEMPAETQIRDLVRELEGSDNDRGSYNAQFSAWIAGDIETTERLVHSSLKANPPRYQILIKKRNAAWLAPLEALLAKPGVHFVAVGTGHLIGPDGLVKLLGNKGYQVTRE